VALAGLYANHCKLLQADNDSSILSLNFVQAGCYFWHPTSNIKAMQWRQWKIMDDKMLH